MPSLLRAHRLLVLLTLPVLLAIPSTGAAGPPVVIVLSLDGTRHDYPERARTPALDRMEQEGARGTLIPAFPPNTFPAHVTLATGAPVDVHGIVGNEFFDRKRGEYRYSPDASWILAEPIWIAAERQGVRAATLFWVGSETDWHGARATYRVAPFDSRVPERTKVDRIVSWLDLPEAERPGVILSWWHGCDHAGHEKGPDHPDVAAALQAQDEQLERLLGAIDARGLWPDLTLLVVSDHGMTEARHTIAVARALKAAGVRAQLANGGGVGYLTLADPAQRELARSALEPLEGLRVFDSDDLPSEWRSYRPERSGELTLLANPPWTLSRVSSPRWAWLLGWLGRNRRGVHGYPSDRPDMWAIFYALGRGVPRGLVLDRVRAIDVAPTVAQLLGIAAPAQSEGRPVLAVEPQGQ